MLKVNYEDYRYYDEAIEALWFNTVDLLKESLESFCIELGPVENHIDYKNYLISNPIEFVETIHTGGGNGGNYSGTYEYSSGPFGMTRSLSIFDDSLDCLNLDAFDYQYSTRDYHIKRAVSQRCQRIPNLVKESDPVFNSTAITVGNKEKIPPLIFLMFALSEGSLRDAPTNNVGPGYGGYFGQTSDIGYGQPLETQMTGLPNYGIPHTYRQCAPHTGSPAEAMGLSYVYHHLPSIGGHIYKYYENIWSTDPVELPEMLKNTYAKSTGKRLGGDRLAESILFHLFSGWAASYITRHQDLYKDFL